MSERVRCVCGGEVWMENWANHLLTRRNRGPHEVFRPSDVLTDEEARLLQRLDALEADAEAINTRGGKILRTRLQKRLSVLAEWPNGVQP